MKTPKPPDDSDYVPYLKTKPKLELGKSYGKWKLYQVVCYNGQLIRESLGKLRRYHSYIVRCAICGNEQPMHQTSIEKSDAKSCRQCTKEQRKLGRERAEGRREPVDESKEKAIMKKAYLDKWR